jgi:hypothetical protein
MPWSSAQHGSGAGDAGGHMRRVATVDDRAGAWDRRVEAGRCRHADQARAGDDRAHIAGGELLSCACPVPPRATSSRAAVPLASSVPLPDSPRPGRRSPGRSSPRPARSTPRPPGRTQARTGGSLLAGVRDLRQHFQQPRDFFSSRFSLVTVVSGHATLAWTASCSGSAGRVVTPIIPDRGRRPESALLARAYHLPGSAVKQDILALVMTPRPKPPTCRSRVREPIRRSPASR